jgi:hypothetical protein
MPLVHIGTKKYTHIATDECIQPLAGFPERTMQRGRTTGKPLVPFMQERP